MKSKIRIIFIGDFTGKGDEGLSQISKKISELVNDCYNVKNINTKDIFHIVTIVEIIKFKPDIIHYITGPTLRSFIILTILKLVLLNNVKTIVSATRPFFRRKYFNLLKIFPIDLIFTQAKKWEIVFKKAAIDTVFLPNPIDTNKFKNREFLHTGLRRKYNLPYNKKILLHIGHIKANRNLRVFVEKHDELVKRNFQVVIVSSSYFAEDQKLMSELKASGVIILSDYFSNIEEIYSLADVYIFPVKGLEDNYFPEGYNEVGVVDMPLTILEALAVGVPILSTHIDALKRLLRINNSKNIVKFWNGEGSTLIDALNDIEIKERINNSNIIKLIDKTNIKNKIIFEYNNLLKI